MRHKPWWKNLVRRQQNRLPRHGANPRLAPTAQVRFRRLILESLEERSLLAVITVTRMDDAVGTGDGVTLREAILAANTNVAVDGSAAGQAAPALDTIVFAPGLSGTISLASGQLSISETVVIQGNGASATIIDAHRVSRVFEIEGTAGEVIFDSVTITGGFDVGRGGGINSLSLGLLTVLNSTISGNSVSTSGDFSNAQGGGIYADRAVTVTGSTISGNSATTAGYGSPAQGGGIWALGAVTVTSSTINENSASTSAEDSNAEGGGIGGFGIVTVTGSTISRNSTSTTRGSSDALGGGIRAATVTVTGSMISGNSATSIGLGEFALGGGVLAFGLFTVAGRAISVTVADSTISGNSVSATGEFAYAEGGGIRAFGEITVLNSTISENVATASGSGSQALGGGIWDEGAVRVTASTITANRVSGLSGATSQGGGIWTFSSPATIRNSIVAGNTDNDGSHPDLRIGDDASTLLVTQASLIGDNNGTSLTAAAVGSPDVNGNLVGTHAAPLDPKLGTLTNNGGQTPTNALLAGSPAIDLGKISHAAALKATGTIDGGSLLALYRFEEQSGATAANATATAGLDGTYGTAVALGAVNSLATADGGNTLGRVATFDGTINSQIVLPSPLALVPGVGLTDFSISLWVKTSQASSDTGNSSWHGGYGLVDGEVSGGESDFGTAVLNGKFAFGVGNPDVTVKSSQTINDDQWHHVVATRSGGVMTVYVDGVLGGTTTGPSSARTASPRLTVGAIQTNYSDDFFSGQIDEVAIYKRALDAGEVAGLFFAEVPPANDQRGASFARVVGSARDAGAFERQTVEHLSLVVDTAIDENDGNYAAGDLSLREAIELTNGSVGVSTISFATALAGQTITLSLGELTVSKSVKIEGLGADKLAISGGSGASRSRVFNFAGSGANTYGLSGVTVKDGNGAGTSAGFGGAIRFVGSDDKLFIADSVIRDSTATMGGTDGGGLFADQGTLELTNVTVMNNTAAFGGGLAFEEVHGTLTNVTISGNTASTRGGGIVQFASRANSTSELLILNSTIADNISAVAAGIRNSTQNGGIASMVTLGNTIVANNTGGGIQLLNAAVAGTSAKIASLGNNITSDVSGNLTGPGDLQNTDPRLAPLAIYNGPLPTHALCTGMDTPVTGCAVVSPAIDAGNNDLAKTAGPDGTFNTSDDVPLVTDARGMPFQRIAGEIVDIGAFEHFVNSPPSCPLLFSPLMDDEQGLMTVPQFVNCSAGEPLQKLTFSLTVDRPDLFTVPPSIDALGKLTFDPKPNVHDSVEITVTIQDDGGTFASGFDKQIWTLVTFVEKKHPLFNAAETGPRRGLDVTGSTSTAPDGKIVAQDALAIINYINAKGSGTIPSNSPFGPPYVDVTGDNQVVAEDVLKVINYINANAGQSEGESGSASTPPATDSSYDSILLLITDEIASHSKRNRKA